MNDYMNEYYDMYFASEIEEFIRPKGEGWKFRYAYARECPICEESGFKAQTFMVQYVRTLPNGKKERIEVCQNCGTDYPPRRKRTKKSKR